MQDSNRREDRLFTPPQAAEYLAVSRKTIETWRSRGDRPQPRFVKLGTKAVRYRQSDLDAFILSGLKEVEDE